MPTPLPVRAFPRSRRSPGPWLLALLIPALLASGTASGETARTRVLRGLTVAPGRNWTIAEIHFGTEFRYLTHSPPRAGKTLLIRVRPELGSVPASDLRAGEVIEWRNRDVFALIDVQLDVDSAGNTQLVFHFETPMEFEVSQDNDLGKLRVAVRPAPVAETDASEPAPRPTLDALPTSEEAPTAGAAPSKADEIMEEARKAMTAGDYPRAILLLTKVVSKPEHPRAPEALELLGLAHQRSRQLAHARAEYEAYLDLYPETEGAPRVRQRLEALLTARDGSQPRASRPAPETGGFTHSFSGSLSQFYRSSVLETDTTGRETTNSSLDSDVFLSSRHSSSGVSLRSNFAASYRRDLLGELDSSDALRVTSAFLDARWGENRFSSRVGRQSASGGGVLGRFDGGLIGVRVLDRFRLNLVGGLPVDFTDSNRVDTDRFFYGVSVDVERFFDHWDGQLFAIQQRLEGVEDRTAAGGQLRFVHPDGFGLGLVDYDVSYGALNTLMLIANWRLGQGTSVHGLVDIRKSPTLTTFNALQGQPVEDFSDLEDLFSESELRDLAEDRTATSRTFTIGASHDFNATWNLSGDVTLSNLSDTKASGGVDAVEGTGNEYYYSLRTNATNLLLEGSFTSFGLRYADASTSDRYSASLGGRYPVIERLRVGPQFIAEFRDNETGDDQWRYRTSLRVDYRWRRFVFEVEAGIEHVKGTTNDADSDEEDYFVTAGYRYDF